MGETEKPRRVATHPMMPSTTMMPTSARLLRIAKLPITVMKATTGTSPALGACTMAR